MRARARLRFARTESPPAPVASVGAESLESEAGGDLTAELRRVAEEHAPEGGYGETAYNSGDGTVYWVPADWSSNDEVAAAHAAFLEIDGVNGVVGDAESYWPTGEGWEQVWPIPGSDAAYERVLALAMRPLDVRPPVEEPLVAGGGIRIQFAERALDSIDAAVRLAAPDERA